MRVLLVSGSFPPLPCGVGDYTSMLAEALGRRADMAVAVLTSKNGPLSRPDAPYLLLAIEDGWRFRETVATTKAVREFAPDAIHFQYPAKGYGPLQWILPSLFRALGYPVYLTLHEYFAGTDPRARLSTALNFPNILAARGIVVTREEYSSLLPSHYARAMKRKNVRHIPIGSNIQTAAVGENERMSIRNQFGCPPMRLLSYFGFVSPQKGVEDIFRIADPAQYHVVLICTLDPLDPVHERILRIINTHPWKGNATVTGFLPSDEVARIIACSDATVLPFRNGSSLGNGTLHAAISQGTFTLTTSFIHKGYNPSLNAYFAAPGNIRDLADSLLLYSGRRIPRSPDFVVKTWDRIAEDHEAFYRRIY